MESLKGCQLAIGMYPTFAYNANGGGGIATATPSARSSSRVDIVFDATAVTIPDVTYRTARVSGVPLPPVFKIRVQPESLQVNISIQMHSLRLSQSSILHGPDVVRATLLSRCYEGIEVTR